MNSKTFLKKLACYKRDGNWANGFSDNCSKPLILDIFRHFLTTRGLQLDEHGPKWIITEDSPNKQT